MSEKTLWQRREDAKNILEKMDNILNLSEEKKEKILENYDKWEKISNFYDNVFSELKDIIEDEESWLDKTYEKAQDALNRIDELEVEVNNRRGKTEELEEQAKDIWKTNKVLQWELEKMLWIASDKVLSRSFEEQERKLNIWAWWWLSVFWLLVIIILWIIFYSIIINTIEQDTLIIRFFIITPIFIVALLSFREYSKEKNKADKYAFKKVKASALESYLELLISRFSTNKESVNHEPSWESYLVDVTDNKSKEKILQFVLDTMNKIYSEPIFSDKILELDLKAKIKEYEMEIKIADKEIKNKSNNVIKD